jgi:hypothetical protein
MPKNKIEKAAYDKEYRTKHADKIKERRVRLKDEIKLYNHEKWLELKSDSARLNKQYAKVKEWRKNNKDKQKEFAQKWYAKNRNRVASSGRLKKYGLSDAEHSKLLLEQNGRCAICGYSNRGLVVDHCHGTGKVRGLLCPTCNRGLGNFNDNPLNLDIAAIYIRKHLGCGILKEKK